MNRRQIAVGVGEGGVDLDGPRVALQRRLDVLHLLQRVAHVAVRVGESWLDPDRLLRWTAEFDQAVCQ